MSSTPSDRKRKHSGKTIKDLFTTQHKPNTATTPLSPSSKRTKLDIDSFVHCDSDTTKTPPPTPTMSTTNMYHFPSKKGSTPSSAEVVDISSSPDNSPAKAIGQKNGLRKSTPNAHANAGPKKLLVKNFKPTRKVDPKVFLDQTWQKVNSALETIFHQGQIDFSLEELYRGVENLCRQGLAKDAKERLVAKCRDYVGGTLKAKVKETVGRTDVDVLRAALQAWAIWNEQMVGSVFKIVMAYALIYCRDILTGSSATLTARISFRSKSPFTTSPSTCFGPLSLRMQSSITASSMVPVT
jgi:cullin-4